jgi:hypothetical protein
MTVVNKGRHGGRLKSYEPGESGNIKGRPYGARNYSTILRELLDSEDKRAGGEGNGLNIIAKELRSLMKAKNEAVKLKALQEAADRIEGKSEETINIITVPQINITFRNAD